MKAITMVMVVGVLLLVLGCAVATPQSPRETVSKSVPLGGNIESRQQDDQRFQVVIENSQFGIKEGEFGAATLVIKEGDTVEWVNKDAVEHTITLENGAFDEKVPIGGIVSYTFRESGSYEYFSELNPGTRGVIVVK